MFPSVCCYFKSMTDRQTDRPGQVLTHLSGSRSYLLNGFPMLPSSPGPCRPPAAGPAAPRPGRCFRSGSLSGRVPPVPPSCSAVGALFRFRITGSVKNTNINGRTSDRSTGLSAGRRPLCGRRCSAESRWGRSWVPAAPRALCLHWGPQSRGSARSRRSQSQGGDTTTCSHCAASTAPGERRRNDYQNKTFMEIGKNWNRTWCLQVHLVDLL